MTTDSSLGPRIFGIVSPEVSFYFVQNENRSFYFTRNQKSFSQYLRLFVILIAKRIKDEFLELLLKCDLGHKLYFKSIIFLHDPQICRPLIGGLYRWTL